MPKPVYTTTRNLQLYAGLFLSPFVLLFAVSVFYLVHAPPSAPAPAPAPPTRAAAGVPVSLALETLSPPDQVAALRPVLATLGAPGEINFIRRLPKEHRLIVPVLLPGSETTVDLDLVARTATITLRPTGFADALVHLHKMPGPHNVALRGNSPYMRLWRYLADATSYGVLFLSLSGLYLWAVLRAERRLGLALLAAGALTCCGLLYALTV
ncbi:MAG: hypothetical protein NTX13_06935 [Acidobacteria bacterium]|nr:hypothetical protein [Acidobacteriota bacterium]